eukprot:Rmarinus@m.4313
MAVPGVVRSYFYDVVFILALALALGVRGDDLLFHRLTFERSIEEPSLRSEGTRVFNDYSGFDSYGRAVSLNYASTFRSSTTYEVDLDEHVDSLECYARGLRIYYSSRTRAREVYHRFESNTWLRVLADDATWQCPEGPVLRNVTRANGSGSESASARLVGSGAILWLETTDADVTDFFDELQFRFDLYLDDSTARSRTNYGTNDLSLSWNVQSPNTEAVESEKVIFSDGSVQVKCFDCYIGASGVFSYVIDWLDTFVQFEGVALFSLRTTWIYKAKKVDVSEILTMSTVRQTLPPLHVCLDGTCTRRMRLPSVGFDVGVKLRLTAELPELLTLDYTAFGYGAVTMVNDDFEFNSLHIEDSEPNLSMKVTKGRLSVGTGFGATLTLGD